MDRSLPTSPTASTATLPRVATAPVNWNNDDLVGWRPAVTFPAILDQMVAAGYDATEYGAGFPADPAVLGAALSARGLTLCGFFCPLDLTDDARFAAQRPDLERLLDLFVAVGCADIVLSLPSTPERNALVGRVPTDGSAGLSDEEWGRLGHNLSLAGRITAARGVRAHFHPHVGTHVETPDEMERLAALLDPAVVDLCIDGGHYAYGGGDPPAFVARHADVIGYVHLKDVNPVVLERSRQHRWRFQEALTEFIFCELGRGSADIPGTVRSLRDAGYAGWLVLEQDTCASGSTETARANRAYLRECCGL